MGGTMPGGYAYDIFLSYRRSGPGNASQWVHNHFFPLLRDSLADQLEWPPRIFIDVQAETGSHWPTLLRQALLRSKVLVAVWCPQYFLSPWCLAEWRSLEAREEVVGGCRLVYPVIFSDSENFPAAARQRQARDLKGWSYPHPGFVNSPKYEVLYDKMREIAVELDPMLRRVPGWDDNWPTVEPTPTPAPRPAFPTL